MPEKFTRKELRGPDAFQKAGFELREWLQERQRLVVLLVVLIFLGGAGVTLGSYVSSRGEAQAARDLGLVLKTVQRPVNAKGNKDPEADPDSGPAFDTQEAKDEALVKELSELRQKYPRSRAAVTAALPLGEAQLRLGRADQALSAFQTYLKGTPADEPLRAEALECQGYAYEAQGQLEQALASFDQLARDSQTEFLSGMGLYHRARILVLQNKKEDAAQVLSQIPVAYPNSAAARMAAERMAELTAQGVKVPSPSLSAAPDAGGQ
jgi:tetratricopeptide (TPR) repeat protein